MALRHFNTYRVSRYHVETEEDLLVRVMAAADVGLPSISDRVYQNMVHKHRVCVEVAGRHVAILVSESRRKTTYIKHQKWKS